MLGVCRHLSDSDCVVLLCCVVVLLWCVIVLCPCVALLRCVVALYCCVVLGGCVAVLRCYVAFLLSVAICWPKLWSRIPAKGLVSNGGPHSEGPTPDSTNNGHYDY